MNETTVPRSVSEVAQLLLTAADERLPQTSISEQWSGMDLETAYQAQDAALQMRLDRGEKLVGIKLGVTSKAKQRQVGVGSPSTAWLTDQMMLPPEAPVPQDTLLQPRVEPEIAFVLGERLKGPGVTAGEAMKAVRYVVGAIEVIDSRFTGYKFTMADVIADNNSSGRFRTGSVTVDPDGLDLGLEAVLLEIDGEVVETATGAAVYGHPAEALAFAANTLGERGHTLEAGWIVLTGGMTDAVPVRSGMRIAAHFTHLGTVTMAGG